LKKVALVGFAAKTKEVVWSDYAYQRDGLTIKVKHIQEYKEK